MDQPETDARRHRGPMEGEAKGLSREGFQHGASEKIRAWRNDDDKDFDEPKSGYSSLEFDLEDDLDDNDLMKLDNAGCPTPPFPLLETWSENFPADVNKLPAGLQTQSSVDDCDLVTLGDDGSSQSDMRSSHEIGTVDSSTPALQCPSPSTSAAIELPPVVSTDEQDYDDILFDEDLCIEMDISDMDEICIPTPPTSVSSSRRRLQEKSKETPPGSQQQFSATKSTKPESRLTILDKDHTLEELDLSTISEFLPNSTLLHKPRTPIQRTPFPTAVSSHSPIPMLTSATLLRTCFRIGEALNTGCNAARNNRHEILELYCRVSSS